MVKKQYLLVLVLLCIILTGVFLTLPKLYSKPEGTEKPKIQEDNEIRLENPNGIYKIQKSGKVYLLTFYPTGTKGVATSIYINNSPMDLSSFVGKQVKVMGVFVEVEKEVECIMAPCNPIKQTVLNITSIKEEIVGENENQLTYQCPLNGWIDCMPTIRASKTYCNPEYIDWAKSNCPDFKGVAY
ncbi:MAG: hypothetical protein AAB443_03445 [Patescibacteria group bacterium]